MHSSAGIVHGGYIKPLNLRFTSSGVLKILDLGVAHTALLGTDTARSGLVAGTVAYMSPEQLHGAWGDVRSDIWSAGAVMFELATGGRAVGRSDTGRPGAVRPRRRVPRSVGHCEPPPAAARERDCGGDASPADRSNPVSKGTLHRAGTYLRLSRTRDGTDGSFAWNDRTH